MSAGRLQAMSAALDVPVGYFFPEPPGEASGVDVQETVDLLKAPRVAALLRDFAQLRTPRVLKALRDLVMDLAEADAG